MNKRVLTETKVRDIRKLAKHIQQKQIAKIFGIATTTVNNVVNYRTWKDL